MPLEANPYYAKAMHFRRVPNSKTHDIELTKGIVGGGTFALRVLGVFGELEVWLSCKCKHREVLVVRPNEASGKADLLWRKDPEKNIAREANAMIKYCKAENI